MRHRDALEVVHFRALGHSSAPPGILNILAGAVDFGVYLSTDMPTDFSDTSYTVERAGRTWFCANSIVRTHALWPEWTPDRVAARFSCRSG